MFKVGDRVEETIQVTDEMIRKFAEVSGDFNPVHLDDEYAKTTRFGRRIAHGMLSAGFISRVLGMQLGSGGIYLGQTLRFMSPVFPGDTLKVVAEVLSMREGKGIGIASTFVYNQHGEVVVKGEATIMSAEFVK